MRLDPGDQYAREVAIQLTAGFPVNADDLLLMRYNARFQRGGTRWTAGKTAATDPIWLGFYSEAYIFAALVYFAICFTGSRYSLWLERKLNASNRR